MKPVDLHPEELFDALRVGILGSDDRARLEAHCAGCSACRFELQWLDTNLIASESTAEDRAYGEAAFDHVLRATRRIKDARHTRKPKHRPLRWGVGGVVLGTTVSLAVLFGRATWSGSTQPVQRDERAATQQDRREVLPRPSPEPPRTELAVPPPSPKPTTASIPSANALLAAARKARTHDDSKRARLLYQRVIDTYPATAAAGAARVALGRLSYELDTSREALRLFDDYLRQYPNGALIEEALYYRALSLARLGHRRQAADGLRALLTSFPNSVYAAQARSQLAEGRGE